MEGLQDIRYISAEDGGTLFENLRRYYVAQRELCDGMAVLPYSADDAWTMLGTMMDNAFYIPTLNRVFVPLGYFLGRPYAQAQTFTEQATLLGFILGHEIGHGFDFNGAKYDAQGKISDWWTEADRAAFNQRCQQVIAYYDGVEFAPGLFSDAAFTVGENMADIFSMRATMLLAAEREDFDYDWFFRGVASYFAISATRAGFGRLLSSESHSMGRARVNPLVSLFDAFYDTYGVEEGDFMYVKKENRVSVW